MGTDVWSLAHAKAKFSEVIEKAKSEGPQTITRNGRKAAVIVSADEWEQRTKPRGTLGDFFASSPLAGSGVKIRRMRMRLRKPAL